MPRWMYGLLGLALAWLVWTNLLKPAPNVSQITTQQGVQVMALENYEGFISCIGTGRLRSRP